MPRFSIILPSGSVLLKNEETGQLLRLSAEDGPLCLGVVEMSMTLNPAPLHEHAHRLTEVKAEDEFEARRQVARTGSEPEAHRAPAHDRAYPSLKDWVAHTPAGVSVRVQSADPSARPRPAPQAPLRAVPVLSGGTRSAVPEGAARMTLAAGASSAAFGAPQTHDVTQRVSTANATSRLSHSSIVSPRAEVLPAAAAQSAAEAPQQRVEHDLLEPLSNAWAREPQRCAAPLQSVASSAPDSTAAQIEAQAPTPSQASAGIEPLQSDEALESSTKSVTQFSHARAPSSVPVHEPGLEESIDRQQTDATWTPPPVLPKDTDAEVRQLDVKSLTEKINALKSLLEHDAELEAEAKAVNARTQAAFSTEDYAEWDPRAVREMSLAADAGERLRSQEGRGYIPVLDAPLEALTMDDFEQALESMALKRNNIEGEMEYLEEIEADQHDIDELAEELTALDERFAAVVARKEAFEAAAKPRED